MNRFIRGARALAAMALVALAACSDDEKQCEDFCGDGAACVGGACVAVEPCGGCADGQACQDGQCVATLDSACGGGCTGADQVCLTNDGAAECVTVCGAGQDWDSAANTCVATADYCGAGQTWDAAALVCRMTNVHAAHFDGKTLANGPAVTAECIKCHAQQAADLMETQHWTWTGPTPELRALVDFVADPTTVQDPGTIGKVNLVNNYCVSVASNEKRCDQCHAGYGAGGKSARDPANAANATLVDCLVCHSGLVKANMTGVSATLGYSKIAGNFGAAGISPAAVATPDSLKAAASAVGAPTRANCGFCHFNAGGADSVKIMSTSLDQPDAAVDVHMAPAGADLTCADCHAGPSHRIVGAGVHTPTNTARLSCEECHSAGRLGAPHVDDTVAGHLDVLACQTCHIPAYSRGQPGKIGWDWATAGYLSKGTIYTCLHPDNTESAPVAGACPEGTFKLKAYDNMKGHFQWGVNVKPAYAWYNGKMTHVTTGDKGAFAGAQTGLSLDAAVTLAAPLGSADDATARIFPFKVMRSRQAVYVDGDQSFVIAPNLFNSGATPTAFWPVTTNAAYVYTPADGEDFGASVFSSDPLAGTFVGAAPYTSATAFDDLLSRNFTDGARAAGQIGAEATLAKFDGATGWDWRYTKMYMDLNHEVAPSTQALACTACHSSTGGSAGIDWASLGYTCANPWSCAKRP